MRRSQLHLDLAHVAQDRRSVWRILAEEEFVKLSNQRIKTVCGGEILLNGVWGPFPGRKRTRPRCLSRPLSEFSPNRGKYICTIEIRNSRETKEFIRAIRYKQNHSPPVCGQFTICHQRVPKSPPPLVLSHRFGLLGMPG